MSLIALLTDFGLNDNYVGAMKGVMLSINPKLRFVDITHEIPSHQIKQASFLLLKSYSYFPQGTIFVAVVDPGVGSERKAIAVRTKNYSFVGPDNGILSLASKEDGIKKRVVLENKKYFLKDVSSTFHGRDIFAPVAAHLSKGIALSSLGRSISKIEKIELPLTGIKNNSLEGKVIYADKFGNLITNIKKEQLDEFLGDKSFAAALNKKAIKKICSYYMEADNKEPFFIEASFGYMEISLKNRSAKEYFGIEDIEKVKVIVKKITD